VLAAVAVLMVAVPVGPVVLRRKRVRAAGVENKRKREASLGL
jgi:hypothetical protein